MSSEPSDRAKARGSLPLKASALGIKYACAYHGVSVGEAADPLRALINMQVETTAQAFDAGHADGEKKGTAVGYLKALREVMQEKLATSDPFTDWLDRRIREAEENSHAVSL